MAYDPKKKRPARDSLDAVVDEIFGEETQESSKAKSPAKKKSSSPASKTKQSATSKKPISAPAKSPDKSQPQADFDKNETLDNVLPLYPQSQETPLIMQPQVWIATGIAALIVLFIARGRKKR